MEVSCIFCGDSVGDDERLIVADHDGDRPTTLAREPELRDRAGALVVHARCVPNARPVRQHALSLLS